MPFCQQQSVLLVQAAKWLALVSCFSVAAIVKFELTRLESPVPSKVGGGIIPHGAAGRSIQVRGPTRAGHIVRPRHGVRQIMGQPLRLYLRGLNRKKTKVSRAEVNRVKSEDKDKKPRRFERRFPDVVIAGASKCGTSVLFRMLGQHSGVAPTRQLEVHYYDLHPEKSLQWYLSKMPLVPVASSQGRQKLLVMEKTPGYYRTQGAAQRILEVNPATKVIMIFRNPIIRILSLHAHFTVKRMHTLPENPIFLPDGRVNTNSLFIQISMYSNFLKAWLDLYPKDQLLILDGQVFIERPWKTMKQVQKFLGISNEFTEESFSLKNNFFCWKGKFQGKTACGGEENGRSHIKLSKEETRRLEEFFAPYNRQLAKMLNRTFTWM